MLAVMAAIVVAIAIPSFTAMQARSHDASARAKVRRAADAIEAFGADRGTYAGLQPAALRRYDASLGTSSYRVEWAGVKRYCVESSSSGRTWHLEGPAGDITRGGCP